MDVRRVQIGWVQVKITRETKKGPRIDVDSSQFAFLFLETLKAIFYMTPKRSGGSPFGSYQNMYIGSQLFDKKHVWIQPKAIQESHNHKCRISGFFLWKILRDLSVHNPPSLFYKSQARSICASEIVWNIFQRYLEYLVNSKRQPKK